jgi:hypothetical protein
VRLRRNPDARTERLQRAWAREGTREAALAYSAALRRTNKVARRALRSLDVLWDAENTDTRPRAMVRMLLDVATGATETRPPDLYVHPMDFGKVAAVMIPTDDRAGIIFSAFQSGPAMGPVWGPWEGRPLVHVATQGVRYAGPYSTAEWHPNARWHPSQIVVTDHNRISGGTSTGFAVPADLLVLWARTHGPIVLPNPDERTRELERAIEGSPGDYMLRAAYARSLMREGAQADANTQGVLAMRAALPAITHGDTGLVKKIAEAALLPRRTLHPADILRSLFGPGEIVGAWISGLRTKKARKQAQRDLWEPVYESRRDRTTNPYGWFDGQGRWYPYDDEDGDGDVTKVRSPSRSWPYSYMLRARTRDHVKHLIERSFQGHDVPPDVESVLRNQANRIFGKLWPRMRKARYNPDEDLRRLERRAFMGTPEERAHLAHVRRRRGEQIPAYMTSPFVQRMLPTRPQITDPAWDAVVEAVEQHAWGMLENQHEDNYTRPLAESLTDEEHLAKMLDDINLDPEFALDAVDYLVEIPIPEHYRTFDMVLRAVEALMPKAKRKALMRKAWSRPEVRQAAIELWENEDLARKDWTSNPGYDDLSSGDLFGHRGHRFREMGGFKVGQTVYWADSGRRAGRVYKFLPHGHPGQLGPRKARGAYVEEGFGGRMTAIALSLLTPHRRGLHHVEPVRNPDESIRRLERAAATGDPEAQHALLERLSSSGELPVLDGPIFIRLLIPGYEVHHSGRGLVETDEVSVMFGAEDVLKFLEHATPNFEDFLDRIQGSRVGMISLEVMDQAGHWHIAEGPARMKGGVRHSTIYLFPRTVSPDTLLWDARELWPAVVMTSQRGGNA